MRDSSNVPRVACHGARGEAARVINEVGDSHFYRNLVIGDEHSVNVASGVPPRNNHLILALVRYQSWLKSNSLARSSTLGSRV